MLRSRHSETLRWVGKREMQVAPLNAILCASHDLYLFFGWWHAADKPWYREVWSCACKYLIWHQEAVVTGGGFMLWKCEGWHEAGIWCCSTPGHRWISQTPASLLATHRSVCISVYGSWIKSFPEATAIRKANEVPLTVLLSQDFTRYC